MLQKAYNFIAFQKVVLILNPENHFVHDKNEIDLTNATEPRINKLRILPFDLETRMGSAEISAPLVNLGYKLLISVFIIAAYENTMIQIFFFILINVLYSIYLIVKKPYIRIAWKQFTSEMIVHNMVVITAILLVILAYKIQLNSLSSDQKNTMGTVMCVFVLYGLISNLLYFAYRTYNYYFEYVWKPFVAS